MTTENKIANIKNLSFEAALKELEEIAATMEGEQNSLDQVIHNYEYGVKLKQYLQKKLDEAKLKISKISTDSAV